MLRCVVLRDRMSDEVVEALDVVDVDMVQVHGPLSNGLVDDASRTGTYTS